MTVNSRFIVLVLMLGLFSGCQKPASPETSSHSSANTSTELLTPPQKTEINILPPSETTTPEWIACPEERAEVCTQIYQPVCGTVDTGIRCVTEPCPSETMQTFGNACTACSNHAVLGYSAGECASDQTEDEDQ